MDSRKLACMAAAGFIGVGLTAVRSPHWVVRVDS